MRPGGVSAPVFATEFCTPMATLQKWEKSIKAQFGSTATDFPQFTRIMKTSAALANPPSRPSIPTHPRTPPAHPPTHMAPAHDTPTAHAATHPPIHAFTHPHIPHPTNLITQPLPPATNPKVQKASISNQEVASMSPYVHRPIHDRMHNHRNDKKHNHTNLPMHPWL